MFKLLHNCTHLKHQQSNAQNSPSESSTVCELRISRCSNRIQQRQRNQRSNCQYPLDYRKRKRVPEKNIYFCFIDNAKPLTVWITREFQKNIYFCLTDYIKTSDCVDHNKWWKVLQDMGIPDHFTCLLENLYAGQEATFRN